MPWYVWTFIALVVIVVYIFVWALCVMAARGDKHQSPNQ